MAEIYAFNPLLYNNNLVPDMGAVIAPPYDVISVERRQELLDRSEYNVVRLIMPDGDESTRYRNAADLLNKWMGDGVLVHDGLAVMLLYAQTFTHPNSGERIQRFGIVAPVKLEPFDKGIILPHERTLSGPKADRLALMHATNANLEAIFSVFNDSGVIADLSARASNGEIDMMIDATDIDGVQHRVWRVSDDADIARIQSELSKRVVYIVDGHHRYETALTYQHERREASPSETAQQPYDSMLMFLSPTNDPGLIILPTHRIVHGLPSFDIDNLLASIGSAFEITVCSSVADAVELLAQSVDSIAFALLAGSHHVVAKLRPDGSARKIVDTDVPEVLRDLDVTVLHDYVFEKLLGISKQAQIEQTNIRYAKSLEDAIKANSDADVQLVVIMNPTKLEQVERVAESGSVMPQKSTFFYPKLASGLVFNTF